MLITYTSLRRRKVQKTLFQHHIRYLDFVQRCVGVLNKSETRCSSSSIIQHSNELLGQLIGQPDSQPILQRPDGNRPFRGVFRNCTNRLCTGLCIRLCTILFGSTLHFKVINVNSLMRYPYTIFNGKKGKIYHVTFRTQNQTVMMIEKFIKI